MTTHARGEGEDDHDDVETSSASSTSTSSSSSSSTTFSGSTDSDEYYERQLEQEWEENVRQLQLAVSVLILPSIGKYLGRKWSYFREWWRTEDGGQRRRACIDPDPTPTSLPPLRRAMCSVIQRREVGAGADGMDGWRLTRFLHILLCLFLSTAHVAPPHSSSSRLHTPLPPSLPPTPPR